MLSVVNAGWHLCLVHKKPFMLSIFMLNVIMLSFGMPSVIYRECPYAGSHYA
jgi:hypothetical protein